MSVTFIVTFTDDIANRRRDAKTHESKTVISGATLDGGNAQAVVKIGFTGKLIVITAYVL